MKQYIVDNPWLAIAVAVVIGLLLGWLVTIIYSAVKWEKNKEFNLRSATSYLEAWDSEGEPERHFDSIVEYLFLANLHYRRLPTELKMPALLKKLRETSQAKAKSLAGQLACMQSMSTNISANYDARKMLVDMEKYMRLGGLTWADEGIEMPPERAHRCVIGTYLLPVVELYKRHKANPSLAGASVVLVALAKIGENEILAICKMTDQQFKDGLNADFDSTLQAIIRSLGEYSGLDVSFLDVPEPQLPSAREVIGTAL